MEIQARALVLVALGVLFVSGSACSSGQASSTSGVVPPDDGSYCRSLKGSACACANDLGVGNTVCVDDGYGRVVPQCDCGDCEPLEVPVARAFKPCGGEPFGLWRSTAYDPTGVPFQFIDSQTGQLALSCASVNTVVSADYRVDIQDGGTGMISFGRSKLTSVLKEGCFSRPGAGGRTYACSATSSCAPGICGRCDCAPERSESPQNMVWSRNGNKIAFNGSEFEYCIFGANMQLSNPSVGLITFQEFSGSGAPAACSLRTKAKCASGAGCALGVCEGAGNCTLSGTELDCNTRQNCAWNANRCGGTAARDCTIADYGVVPGCIAR
jgi:hypothetical protein